MSIKISAMSILLILIFSTIAGAISINKKNSSNDDHIIDINSDIIWEQFNEDGFG